MSAERAGVSVAGVSYVPNDRDIVKPETRGKRLRPPGTGEPA
jgi:Transcriptional regulators